MSAQSEQHRREEVRREARAYLAERQGLAFAAASIARAIRAEPEETKQALTFLVGLGQVAPTADALGATQYFQATAAGVLAHERGE